MVMKMMIHIIIMKSRAQNGFFLEQMQRFCNLLLSKVHSRAKGNFSIAYIQVYKEEASICSLVYAN